MFYNLQVIQLNRLRKWIEKLPEKSRPDIDLIIAFMSGSFDNEAERDLAERYTQAANRFFCVSYLHPMAHLSKMEATIDYYARAFPALFTNNTHALVSSDYTGPYVLMPRIVMNALRHAMAADAFTAPTASKPAAIAPFITLNLTSNIVDPNAEQNNDQEFFKPIANAPMFDSFRMHCTLDILAHWLRVPPVHHSSSMNICDRVGMASYKEPQFDFVIGGIHHVVELLFGPLLGSDPSMDGSARFDLLAHTAELNGLRSFMMINAIHYMSPRKISEVVRETTDEKYDGRPQFGFLREFLVGLLDAAGYTSKRNFDDDDSDSCGKRQRTSQTKSLGRPTNAMRIAAAMEPIRGRLPLVMVKHGNRTTIRQHMSDGNALKLCSDSNLCISLINVWMFELLIASGDRSLFMEFETSTRIEKSAYSHVLYSCPPSAIDVWDLATCYLKQHLNDTASPHKTLFRMRDEFKGDDGVKSYKCFALFLHQLERQVCMTRTTGEGSKRKKNYVSACTSRCDMSKASLDQERQLVSTLSTHYSSATEFDNQLPMSVCYDEEEQVFRVLTFDASISVVELIPGHNVGTQTIHRASDIRFPAMFIDMVHVIGGSISDDDPRAADAHPRRLYESVLVTKDALEREIAMPSSKHSSPFPATSISAVV